MIRYFSWLIVCIACLNYAEAQPVNLVPNGNFDSIILRGADACKRCWDAYPYRLKYPSTEAHFVHNTPHWRELGRKDDTSRHLVFLEHKSYAGRTLDSCNRNWNYMRSLASFDPDDSVDNWEYMMSLMDLPATNKGLFNFLINLDVGEYDGKCFFTPLTRSYIYNKLAAPLQPGKYYTIHFKFSGHRGYEYVLPDSNTFWEKVPFGMALTTYDPQNLRSLYGIYGIICDKVVLCDAGMATKLADRSRDYHLIEPDLAVKPMYTLRGKVFKHKVNFDSFPEFRFAPKMHSFTYHFKADSAYSYIIAGAFGSYDKFVELFCKYWGLNGHYGFSLYLDDVSLMEYFKPPKQQDVFLCKGESKMLRQDSANAAEWIMPDGTKITGDSVEVNWKQTGKWYAKNGNVTDSFLVSLVEPAANLENKQYSCCAGDTVKMTLPTVPSGKKVLWGDGYTGKQRYLSVGTIKQVVVEQMGCKDSINYTLTVNPNPQLSFQRVDTFCGPEEGTVMYDYVSSPGSILTIKPAAVHNSAKLFFGQTGDYLIHTRDTITGCSSDYKISVYNDCGIQFYVPNAFSPDDNGRNETWGPKGIGFIIDEIQIYSRWGQLIYQGSKNWDGKSSGRDCEEGVYIYKLVLRDNRQNPKYATGTLHLIR
jgi:gliding motility-associated-like protein